MYKLALFGHWKNGGIYSRGASQSSASQSRPQNNHPVRLWPWNKSRKWEEFFRYVKKTFTSGTIIYLFFDFSPFKKYKISVFCKSQNNRFTQLLTWYIQRNLWSLAF